MGEMRDENALEHRPYSTDEIALTMSRVSKIVSLLSDDGFDVNRIVIGSGQRVTIFLYCNDRCRELIKNGTASYGYYSNKTPIRQGVFDYHGCRVVWSETFM